MARQHTIMPFEVAGEHFASVAAFRRRLTAVLDEIGPTTDLARTHPDHMAFVMGAMRRHPEADQKLAGLRRVELVCARPSNAITGVLHYEGGRFDDISLRGACVTGKGRAEVRPGGGDAWGAVPSSGGPSMFADKSELVVIMSDTDTDRTTFL
jgi:hypothetical protein